MTNKTGKALAPKSSESKKFSTLSDAHGTQRVVATSPTGPDAFALRHNSNNEEGPPTPAPPSKPQTISTRRLEANRRNAKRSTGPRTAQGKLRSRANALRHGLLSTALLFGSDCTSVDPELQVVYESLQREFGREDAETEALLRSLVVEFSHQRRALELEGISLQSVLDGSSAVVSLHHLLRYQTASRRALLKHLADLHRLPERESQ